jgi:hypothetical protein
MVERAARPDLPRSLPAPGRHRLQDPRRRHSAQQGRAPGRGRRRRGPQTGPRDLDRDDGRGQVLAPGHHRTANRGVEDVLFVCCDGLRGLPEAIEATWPQAIVQTCVVHLVRARCATAAIGTQGRHGHPQDHLPGRHRGRSGRQLRPVQGRLRGTVPGHRRAMGGRLGALRAVPRLPGRDPHGDLHDQRHREHQLPATEGDQEPRPFPQRRRSSQAALPGHPELRRSDPCQGSETDSGSGKLGLGGCR